MSNDNEGGNSNSNTAVVSEDGARQVLSQLVRLGYFHDSSSNTVEEDGSDDNLEAFRKWQTTSASSNSDCSQQPSSWDGHCRIILTTSQDLYYTRNGLIQEIIQRLQQEKHQGRASLSNLCRDLQIDYETVFLSTQDEVVADAASTSIWNCFPETVTILKQNMELISDIYWEKIRQEVATQVKGRGSLNVVELSAASHYNLPLEVFVERVVSRLSPSEEVTYMEDSKCLVSKAHLDNLQHDVLDHFRNLQKPTQIGAVCQHHGWDLEQVLEWLQEQEKKGENCHGEVHVDGTTTTHQTAMYVPSAYRKRQEQDVLDFLSTNGFITADRAPNRHLLKTLVADAFPDAFCIGDFEVVVLDQILEEVKAGIQDYLASSQNNNDLEVLNLQEYLPADLVQPDIVPSILAKIDFNDDQGVAIVAQDQAIVVKKELIQKIEEQQLSQLVEEFAKERAQELFQMANSHDEQEADDDVDDDLKAHRKGGKSKSKRGRTKQKKSAHSNESHNVATGIVPLFRVANAIIEAYPSFQTGSDAPESARWEEDEMDGDSDDSSIVVIFCRRALYTVKFQQKCERAMKAELKRLQSEKDSKAKLSRKDAAAKVRSVEAAFEEAFVTLCYLIQAQTKFISFASSAEPFDEQSMTVLKQEFLSGPCADITSRITQQCVFKEEQDCLFTFDHPGDDQKDGGIEKEEQDQIGLPEFCLSVDIAARQYRRVFLSCPPPREPLPVLRESFSGNTGVSLSRQWILCGGECYHGGTRKIDNEENKGDGEVLHIRPGNMEGFVTHLEENCLTLCGLPFKKLDKKGEKSFLFSRKQQLTRLLALATDPLDILEYTIMLLFQQVRQLVVSGSLLRGPILSALELERKIPASVAAGLKVLSDAIESDGEAANDETLLNLIKECGACRDISKHDTSPLEEHLSKY